MQKNQIRIGGRLFTVKKEYVSMLSQYKKSKQIEVGENINCVVCSSEFTKKKASYVFCSLQCKDDFWNKIDPRKRNSKRGKTQYNNADHYHDWCTRGDDMEACDYHNKD